MGFNRSARGCSFSVPMVLTPALPTSPAAAQAARECTNGLAPQIPRARLRSTTSDRSCLNVVEPARTPAAEETAELVAAKHDAPQHRHVRCAESYAERTVADPRPDRMQLPGSSPGRTPYQPDLRQLPGVGGSADHAVFDTGEAKSARAALDQ